MKKTLAATFTLIGVVLLIAYCIGVYPFIVLQKPEDRANLAIIRNENKPFQQFDFQKGNYTAYVVISINDLLNSWAVVPRNRVIKSSDKHILNQLKTCEFISSGNDSLNVESHIYLLKDDSLVYKTGLILDHDYEGINSEGGGWAESKEKGQLLRIFHQFEKEIKPVVFVK